MGGGGTPGGLPAVFGGGLPVDVVGPPLLQGQILNRGLGREFLPAHAQAVDPVVQELLHAVPVGQVVAHIHRVEGLGTGLVSKLAAPLGQLGPEQGLVHGLPQVGDGLPGHQGVAGLHQHVGLQPLLGGNEDVGVGGEGGGVHVHVDDEVQLVDGLLPLLAVGGGSQFVAGAVNPHPGLVGLAGKDGLQNAGGVSRPPDSQTLVGTAAKALDIMNGRKSDPSFYPVIYGLREEDDWNDEKNWYKANPSLGHTISIDRVRDAYREALDNPAEENVFKQLRLNIWTNSAVAWIPEHIYDRGNQKIDYTSLLGRDCYAGLDLSSTSDITALVLVFPSRTEEEKYIVLPFFWLPEETLELRCRRDHVLYDVWERQGYILTTEGNVIHYGFIERFIEQLGEKYHIVEIAYDRWNATQMVQNLEDMGFTMVPFGQGFKDMSPPSKELYKLLMEGNIIHGGNPVLKWMAQNVVMRQDPAGNIKPDKEKSVEKIDGIVALIMGLDRCIRSSPPSSVYDTRGILFI